MAGPTQTQVDFLLRTQYDDLPSEVVRTIKQILLDSIGCSLGGHAVDRGKIAMELVQAFGGNSEASIIGGWKTSPPLAAFANGELMNALDYDVVGPVGGHVAPAVIPPTLAAAEARQASGKDLITALAVALEIGGRVLASIAGRSIPKKEPPYVEDAPRFSYSPSVFGGVAGAGKLLRLDGDRMTNAFGIAGASTPVGGGIKWEYSSAPAIMVKHNCWFGWVAQLATVAALAAERGFTGDATILDGERGFWNIYGSPFVKQEILTKGLGKLWHVEEVQFKPYPACRSNHAQIDATNRIMRENKIEPADIESILIQGSPVLLSPNRMLTDMKSFADTQFSNAYIAAVAVYYGRMPSASWQLPTTFGDPRIVGLMKKVKVAVHPRAEEIMAAKVKAGGRAGFHNTIVEIVAKGHAHRAEVEVAKGARSNPLTDEELKHKFRDNANYSPLKTSKVERAIEAIYGLERIDNVAQLMKLLSAE